MSAVIIKGIIISLSVVAAVGIALQSPEVQQWLEEQRRKLAELLKTVTNGIDAQTRREAEAFAYEGRMPTVQESTGMNDAIAVATGRETDAHSTGRRLNRQNSEAIDIEERRRLGREYLARRNQELLDMKKKRQSEGFEQGTLSGTLAGSSTSHENHEKEAFVDEKANITSNFDTLINTDGSLRLEEKRASMISEATSELPTYHVTPVAALADTSAFDTGAQYGNPFADEFSMSDPILDRSETPRPPLPPKIPKTPEMRAVEPRPIPEPISIPVESSNDNSHDLSYDEQLARALSISLAESEANSQRTRRRTMTEDEAFAQAVAESLRDAELTRQILAEKGTSTRGPLVDFSSDVSQTRPMQAEQSNNPWRNRTEDEDLYWLTPMPTGQKRQQSQATEPLPPMPEDFARALQAHIDLTESSAAASAEAGPDGLDRSRTLSPAVQLSRPTTATFSPSVAPVDTLSSGFQSDSEADDFASLPDNSAPSVGSIVEVEDVDIESMSDSDDGIATPSSWSDVGSEVGDSERSESEAGDMVRL